MFGFHPSRREDNGGRAELRSGTRTKNREGVRRILEKKATLGRVTCAESSQRSAQQSPDALEFTADLPGIRMIVRLAFVAAIASPMVLEAAPRQQIAFVPTSGLGSKCNRYCYAAWASPPPPRPRSLRSSTHGTHQRKSCSRLETKMMVATTEALPGLDSPAGVALAGEGLKPQDWKALLEAGELISLKPEQLLISQGDVFENPDDREVYLLLEGECRIEVKGKGVGQMGPGEFVGEGARETPFVRLLLCMWEGKREEQIGLRRHKRLRCSSRVQL